MNGESGKYHPLLGARIARWFFGDEYGDLVLYHSRAMAELHGAPVSRMCWPDKVATAVYPKWLYLLLANLSGEIGEYKRDMGLEHLGDSEWVAEIRERATKSASKKEQFFVEYEIRMT